MNTGNFSVLQEGSTLVKDHKTAVDALNDVLAATDADQAKATARAALKQIGESVTPTDPRTQTQMVDPAEATHVQKKMETR